MTPAPAPHLGFWSTKGNTCSSRTPVVLSGPTRCRILDYVIRLLPVLPAEKTGGSRPRTRDRPHRIERCSPSGRPCRNDSKGSSAALPMGVCEGHRCGAGVVDAFAPAGYPTQRSAGALHLVSQAKARKTCPTD